MHSWTTKDLYERQTENAQGASLHLRIAICLDNGITHDHIQTGTKCVSVAAALRAKQGP